MPASQPDWKTLDTSSANIKALIKRFPVGYSEVLYANEKYGLSIKQFNQGKSTKLYAKALSGTDFVSLNFYETDKKDLLKPCEMPIEKVVHFMQHAELITDAN